MLFTILNAHTIRGLPIPHAERVVSCRPSTSAAARTRRSYPDFKDLARFRLERVAGMAAFTRLSRPRSQTKPPVA